MYTLRPGSSLSNLWRCYAGYATRLTCSSHVVNVYSSNWLLLYVEAAGAAVSTAATCKRDTSLVSRPNSLTDALQHMLAHTCAFTDL